MTQEIFASAGMAIVLAALGWGLNRFSFREDERKIVHFLLQSARSTRRALCSTEVISAATNLEAERVAKICARSARVRGSQDNWELVE